MICKKRRVYCFIYNKEGSRLAAGYNQCFPPFGECKRMNINQDQDNYTGYECNSIHAEVVAMSLLSKDSKPYKAVLIGHDFYCKDCEAELKKIGVKILEIKL